MGTIRPNSKQRKQHFCNLDDAIATQAAWENERMQNGAALRPKITRLTQAELAQAEAALEMLRGTGFTLIDAARHLFRAPMVVPTESPTIGASLEAFLSERIPFFIGRRLWSREAVHGSQRQQTAPLRRQRSVSRIAAMDTKSAAVPLRVVILKWDRLYGDMIRRQVMDVWPQATVSVFHLGFDALQSIQECVPNLFITDVKLSDTTLTGV